MLQGMRKRPVSGIMQQNGNGRRFGLLFGDTVSFPPQGFQGPVHQVHSPECMVKACMKRIAIDKVSERDLFDPSQTVQVGMGQEVKKDIVRNTDEPVNRIVDYFFLVMCHIRTYWQEICSNKADI